MPARDGIEEGPVNFFLDHSFLYKIAFHLLCYEILERDGKSFTCLHIKN